MAAFSYIEKQHQLDLAVGQLADAAVIAVDTESSGYFTYQSDLCLIQISSGEYHYVIDVLVGLDLSGLGRVFANPEIVKIFHGAQSDAAEIKHSTGYDLKNVFDTLLACRTLGHASCSLAALVKEYFNVTMTKKEQKSNWTQRPLTRSQLEYAHLDTVYLERLREQLLAQLDDPELLEELRQEFERSIRQVGERSTPDPERNWIRVNGAADLDPRRRGILKALYIVREDRARKDNIAPFRLMTNDSLMRLARQLPDATGDLRKLVSANPRFLRKDAERLLEARNAPEVPDSELPQEEEPGAEIMSRMKRLKKWRRHIAEYRGVEYSIILSNRALMQIAERMPESDVELRGLDLMSDWKHEKYAAQILAVLQGKYDREIPSGLPQVEPREPSGVRPARR